MTDQLLEVMNSVHGLISYNEVELLYRLASEVPEDGTVCEIGSYQGRSTIALALGAKMSGATVWAIDSHSRYQTGDTHYSATDNQQYYANVAKFEVGDVIMTINLPSPGCGYGLPTDLLWIDGSHDYEDVRFDFYHFSRLVKPEGKVALHDSSGHYPDVTRLLNEVLESGRWKLSECIDAISVLCRV